jgi:hypothetical protein
VYERCQKAEETSIENRRDNPEIRSNAGAATRFYAQRVICVGRPSSPDARVPGILFFREFEPNAANQCGFRRTKTARCNPGQSLSSESTFNYRSPVTWSSKNTSIHRRTAWSGKDCGERRGAGVGINAADAGWDAEKRRKGETENPAMLVSNLDGLQVAMGLGTCRSISMLAAVETAPMSLSIGLSPSWGIGYEHNTRNQCRNVGDVCEEVLRRAALAGWEGERAEEKLRSLMNLILSLPNVRECRLATTHPLRCTKHLHRSQMLTLRPCSNSSRKMRKLHY